MELNLTQRAIFDRFAKQYLMELDKAIHNEPVTNFGTSPVNASGKLSRSLRYEITDTGVTFYSEDYIWYLVYGRKPGNLPYKVIYQWIIDKNIIPRDGISRESLTFLIWRKIKNEGTTIYRELKGRPSKLFNYIRNQELFDLLTDDLAKTYALKFKSEILNHAITNQPATLE